MELEALKKDAAGLVTVVVQDRLTGAVRMVAHASEEAVAETLRTGDAHFFSRSRQKLWRKGEESGNVIQVSQVWVDCDADCLIYLADPAGPSCHTGRDTCFFRTLDADGKFQEHAHAEALPALAVLWAELERRRDSSAEKSYTKHLLQKGAGKIGEKIREEADELARAVADESDERVVSEAADVLYHALVGMLHRGVSLRDLQGEIARRFGTSGHDEKASRD